jgi:hypothetical protein
MAERILPTSDLGMAQYKTDAEPHVERKVLAILRVLAAAEEPLGARNIAVVLRDRYGINLSERGVRYHLKLMDERGLTQGLGEPGRVITPRGREELENAFASDKLGFVISRIDSLAYRTSLNMETSRGAIVMNFSFIPEDRFPEALEIMKEVFAAGYCMSELVFLASAGDRMDDLTVPAGTVAFGTVCTVTLNGVLLKMGIPVESRYGGVLEVDRGQAVRFTDLVSYAGSTLDPTEMFILGRRTQVLEAVRHGRGKILASFREVPSVSAADLAVALRRYNQHGLSGVLAVGRPGLPLLQVPVGMDRIGVAVVAGLTPVAALEEAGIPAVSKAMSALMPLERLVRVWDL